VGGPRVGNPESTCQKPKEIGKNEIKKQTRHFEGNVTREQGHFVFLLFSGNGEHWRVTRSKKQK